jgi:hypothetical protein
MGGIENGKSSRVAEHRGRLAERDAVFFPVGLGLDWIPIEFKDVAATDFLT